jgi:excinuclease UvrABC nuclease subunit
MVSENHFEFEPQRWHTPNTYDPNYKYPPKGKGVYLLVANDLEKSGIDKYTILYVGSSANLKQRYSNHQTLNFLQSKYDYVQFYFKECDNYIEVEKSLIKVIQPKFNKQWR